MSITSTIQLASVLAAAGLTSWNPYHHREPIRRAKPKKVKKWRLRNRIAKKSRAVNRRRTA